MLIKRKFRGFNHGFNAASKSYNVLFYITCILFGFVSFLIQLIDFTDCSLFWILIHRCIFGISYSFEFFSTYNTIYKLFLKYRLNQFCIFLNNHNFLLYCPHKHNIYEHCLFLAIACIRLPKIHSNILFLLYNSCDSYL